MSKDYRGFSDQLAGDLAKASMAAHSFVGSKTQKLRLTTSDMAAVPAGAFIYVEPATFHKLRAGDIIYVRSGKDLVLRRFLRLEIDGVSTNLVVTAGGAPQETIASNAIMGKVVRAEYQGQEYDPGKEGLFAAVANRLTDYGSVSPAQKVGRSVSGLVSIFRKKK